MQHHFDVDLATRYGIAEAILLNHLEYWIEHNRANQKNFFEGRYWTFNSNKALREIFPYLSEKKIRNALNHLQEEGLILTGNFNKLSYDRTLWYALTEKGKSILPKGQMEVYETANGSNRKGEPIPPNDPYDVTNNREKRKRFIPPSVDEVRAYCQERKNRIDPEAFVAFYASKGWKIGSSKMENWKQAVITWEKRSGNKKRQDDGPERLITSEEAHRNLERAKRDADMRRMEGGQ